MWFSVDGIIWTLPCDIKRSVRVEESDLSGQMISGAMSRDVIGTYFDYDVALVPNPQDMESYYEMFNKLSEPVGGHVFIFPFNGNTIQLNSKVESLKDVYVILPGGGVYWKGIRFSAVSNAPTYVDDGESVTTYGIAPMPDIQDPMIGDTYTYTSDGWRMVVDVEP